MNKSTAGKKRIVIVAAFVILIVVMAAMFMIVRYTPTKEKMNGYVFFNLDKSTDKTMVIIDGKQYSDIGVVTDGRHYLPQEFVADNINGKAEERKISAATQQRVAEAMRDLGYQPNLSARRLRSQENERPVIAFFWPLDYRVSILASFLNFWMIRSRF